jgi:predicted ribosomally synthesized peptide with SipW-like signal peptide
MKNVVLSVVVICALAAGGLGGTFAHFSDTEESIDNYLEVGSLDLQVNGFDDPFVPPKIHAICMAPEKSRDFTIELENMGQCDYPAYLWMHIKNIQCGELPQHKTGGMPEPERVAQDGGRVDQVDVCGVGIIGEDCTLAEHISIKIWYDENDDGVQDLGEVQEHKIAELECINKFLGRLDPCQLRYLYIDVVVQDIDEDDILTFAGVDNDGDGLVDEDGRGCVGDTPGVDDDLDGLIDEDPAVDDDPTTPGVDEGGYFDGMDPDIQFKCWDKWPSNALMKDWMSFDILFSLSQMDP